jgi:hypothetical protein
MIAGMVILGAVIGVVLGLLGCSNLLDHAVLHGYVMAANMSIGMGLWMRYRGHTWRYIGQMAAAMFLPFVLLTGPFWGGLVSGGLFLAVSHVLMLPAMLVVMLRHRSESPVARHVDIASKRVMGKSGMTFVRTFHQEWPFSIEGDEHGDVEYALRKIDLAAKRLLATRGRTR